MKELYCMGGVSSVRSEEDEPQRGEAATKE
jgi:hypothetical protein